MARVDDEVQLSDRTLDGGSEEEGMTDGGENMPDLRVSSNESAKIKKDDDGGGGEKPGSSVKEGDEPVKKASKVGEIWDKIGLDLPTAMMMFKASLPPTIAIAFYQATDVADTFTTLGYLVPIISVLGMCIMPRAKYIQTLVFNLIGICVGSSVALLGIWSVVQARLHTTAPGSTATYNSSQAAVCAIWLFANIWFVNTLRAKMPALAFPVIMYSIFTNVAFTYGPIFTTMAAGEALIQKLLLGFLTALAISTGVSLFILPVTSRSVVFKEQAGYIGLMRACIKAQTAYLQSLETTDMFFTKQPTIEDRSTESGQGRRTTKKSGRPSVLKTPQAAALKASLDGLRGLHGKLYGDIPFAKREFAWGKLTAKDIDKIFTLFRGILIPLIGMSTVTDIFERIAKRRGWTDVSGEGMDEKEREKEAWNEIMKTLHSPFETLTTAMDEGFQHAELVLELSPKPKTKMGDVDVEGKGDSPKPGDPEFAKYLEKKVTAFYVGRGDTLRAWERQKGLTEEQFNSGKPGTKDIPHLSKEEQHRHDQKQLYLILYLEHLLFSTGVAVLNLVKFADEKVADETMAKRHLIVPGKRRLWKWITSMGQEDAVNDNENAEAGVNNVHLGSGFSPKKDPEHLPPETTWQNFGNYLRVIPHFLGSVESTFGFRAACATLSVAIVAFLEKTQTFFIEQRLVWAMIIIAIGMTVTSGQSIFGLLGRVAGTAISMIFSLLIWYIPGQQTGGIIPMLWLFIFLEYYLFFKFPRFIQVWIMAIVTQVLIIGYELQVRKIGIAAASASGQPYYPIYLLGPYRLATVAGGCLVAFFWTHFPYPLTDRSWLRRDLGSTLYLLANYYSVVHSTIDARMRGEEGDMDVKTSPGRKLQKARHKIFGKLMLILPSLRQHSDWQKWEVTIGGRFPAETYEAITHHCTNILNYLSLISYTTETWTHPSSPIPIASSNPNAPNPNPSSTSTDSLNNPKQTNTKAWLHSLSLLTTSLTPTSHTLTALLTLLSFSITQGSALPPYIENQLPAPYDLSKKLEELDRVENGGEGKGLLHIANANEEGYSAYAVLVVCSGLVGDEVRALVELVGELVGETDFGVRREGRDGGKGKRE